MLVKLRLSGCKNHKRKVHKNNTQKSELECKELKIYKF